MTQKPLLDIRDLSLSMRNGRADVSILDDVNFSVAPGEVLGLVGESGSGKSMSALATMGFVGRRRGHTLTGSIEFEGEELTRLDERAYREIRGSRIGMIFQEPMTALDPSFTIGRQISEGVLAHTGATRAEAKRRVIEVLDLVRIPNAAARFSSYPHEFSGGMRQRVLIAMALVNDPALLIADEPTTALDVSIQAQILELIQELQASLGLAVLFITHNMGVVADVCDRVAVMYAGHIVELGGVHEVFADPRHPYTERLLAAMPRVDQTHGLEWIPGTPPLPGNRPTGCRFAPRCDFAVDACGSAKDLTEQVPGHFGRCDRIQQITWGPKGATA